MTLSNHRDIVMCADCYGTHMLIRTPVDEAKWNEVKQRIHMSPMPNNWVWQNEERTIKCGICDQTLAMVGVSASIADIVAE